MLTVNSLLDGVFDDIGFVESADRAFEGSVSLAEYCGAMYRGYTHTAYQVLLDSYLEQVADYVVSGGKRGIGRFMCFMPPRHGKTLKISRLFPSWLLGHTPDLRMITASYGAQLAKRNSRFVRNLIDSNRYREYFPNVRLADDTAAANEWDVAEYGGGMLAVGVGTGVTGHGARLIIIDDPVKSRAEAESDVFRERLYDWYTDDLLTRLEEPGGAIIVMQTRWHQADLAGWLLDDENGREWTTLTLPALAGRADPMGRNEGEALWEERYSADWLHKRRARMGEYSFASLYQQTPLPSGGGLFDATKIEVVDYTPECAQVVRFYDLAVTAKKTSDYTVGLKLGITADERPVILDVWRGQRELPDVQEVIVQNAMMDGSAVPLRLEAEKAGIVQLQYLLRDARMRPYAVDAVPPEGDKYTRAAPIASRVNAGRVLMVKAAWNRALLDELAVFPAGGHDDQVDALSGAYAMLTNTTTPDWGYASV